MKSTHSSLYLMTSLTPPKPSIAVVFTQADYAHVGQTAGSGAGATANTAIPEPATLPLMFASASLGAELQA